MPSSSSMFALALAGFGITATNGHICLFHPQQRGDAVPTNLGPGNSLCYRRTPYCGGVETPDKAPAVNTFLAGTDAQVVFQQNLNHFWQENPGSLDVAISYDLDPSDSDSSWETLLELTDYAANEMVTQTNFSSTIRIPEKAADHAILRFRYVSHNTAEIDPANNTESIFYNCADIRIVENAVANDEIVAPTQPAAISDKKTCSTPGTMALTAVETTSRGAISHEIYYDNVHELVAWTRTGPLYEANVHETRRTVTFYNETIPGQPNTTKPEYVIETDASGKSTCTLFGGDPMYAWEFGEARQQTLTAQWTDDGRDFEEWTTIDGVHRSIAVLTKDGSCSPFIDSHPSSTIVYTSVDSGIPSDAFDLPSTCKKPVVGHGIH